MPATIDFSRDRRVVDNLETVTITNPDNESASTTKALQRATQPQTVNQNGIDIVLKTTRWHVWVEDLSGLVPAQHGYVTDSSGNNWYIDSVSLMTGGTRYEMNCTLQAGLGLR